MEQRSCRAASLRILEIGKPIATMDVDLDASDLATEPYAAERRLKHLVAIACRKPIKGGLIVKCVDAHAHNEIWPRGGEVRLVVDGINCDLDEAQQIAEALEEIAARLRHSVPESQG